MFILVVAIARLVYLEGVEQVVKTPGDDDVIVETDEKGDQGGSNTQAAQPWMDDIPRPERALT